MQENLELINPSTQRTDAQLEMRGPYQFKSGAIYEG